MREKILCAAVILVILTAGLASAAAVPELDSVVEPPEKKMAVKAGLGVAAVPDYEGSKDYKGVPIPFVSVVASSGMSAELLGNVLRANIIPGGSWQFGPLLRFRGERNDVDNDQVDSMEKVDSALEAGGYAGFKLGGWGMRIDVAHDTSGTYNGTVGNLSLGYTWLLERWRLTLSGLASAADDRYMQTYFGVNAANRGSSTLPNYSLGGGFKDAGGSLLASYKLDDRWGLLGLLRCTVLLGDAADSPLVKDEGSESQVILGILATYSF